MKKQQQHFCKHIYIENEFEIKITNLQLLSCFTKYRNPFPPPTTFSVEHCILAKSRQPLRSLQAIPPALQKITMYVTKRDVKLY